MLEPIAKIDWLQANRNKESPRFQWMGFNTTTDSRQARIIHQIIYNTYSTFH